MTERLIGLVLLVVGIAWLIRRFARAPRERAVDELQRLLQMVGGDREAARRLIREEKTRRPELDTEAAARSARRRLEADRR